MPWTDVSFTFASTLTADQLNQIQANFAAMAAGETGAPDIDAAVVIDDNSITPDKLETTHVTVTHTGSANAASFSRTTFNVYPHSAISGTWGDYSINFWPTCIPVIAAAEYVRTGWAVSNDLREGTQTPTNFSWGIGSHIYGGPTIRFQIIVTADGALAQGSHTFKMRAVEASPPYYLGDEFMPGFIFLNTGEEYHTEYFSSAPPWASSKVNKIRKRHLNECSSLEEFLCCGIDEIKIPEVMAHPFVTDDPVYLIRPDDKILRLFEDHESHNIWDDIMHKFKPVPCRHTKIKGCPEKVSMCGISFERRK